MAELVTFKIESEEPGSRLGVTLSVALHLIVFAALFIAFNRAISSEIVAAGPGEGGEGGGGSIEVGVTDKSAILGFAKPQPVSHLGDADNEINNTRVETLRRSDPTSEALLPPTEKVVPDPKSLKTDRPVVNQQEKIFTGKDERGRSQSQSAQVGRSFGNPTPTALIGGVGIGSGGGFGSGTGLPGGSEYGRRIQSILGRNYSPPSIDSANIEYVVIVLRIARDGRILSLSGGRLASSYVKRRSANAQVNYAAERAVIAADPLPPFPSGFLAGAQEATAEVWFRYPK
ncbi:MAG TPA: TonB C-terminal domain-containing protein [Blastocatellia bacterium]|nr:TonB C-terminal domain-containing protein [Blastocatellia bacterium]